MRAKSSDYIHEIEGQVDCQTDNLVYCLSCDKCSDQYVGETEKTLAVRMNQNRGYVRNEKQETATGDHFNLPGHSMANMRVTVLEKIHLNDPKMRKTRESYYFKKCNSFHNGMNRKP